MKKLLKKIGSILIVLAIAGYYIVFYPLKMHIDQYGEPVCESLIGLTVGC